MFDGDYKSRRAISVGGVKSRVDKEALLRRAAADRAARAAEALRLRSVHSIQAFVRGRFVIAAERKHAQDEVEIILSRVESQFLSGTIPESPVLHAIENQKDLLDATRLMLFAYSEHPAVAAANAYLTARLANLLRISSKRTYDADFSLPEWSWILPSFLVLCIKAASREGSTLKLVVHVLTKVPTSKLSSEIPNALSPFHGSEIQDAFTIISLILNLVPPFTSIMETTTHFMSVPHLCKLIASFDSKFFLDSFPIRNWLAYLNSRFSDRQFIDSSAAIYLIANLTLFTNAKFSGLDAAAVTELASVFKHLIGSMDVGYFTAIMKPENLDDSDNDDSDDEFDASIPMKGIIADSKNLEALDEAVKNQLILLTEGPFISSLMEAAVLFKDSSELRTESISLILSTVYHWPTKKSVILNELTFKSKVRFIQAIIFDLKKSEIWKSADERSGWSFLLNDSRLADVWPSFVVLCEALCHQLQYMSDNEVLDLVEPVSLDDIVVLSGILRNHWQMTSEIEMQSFIQSAIADSDVSTSNRGGNILSITRFPTSPIRSITSNNPRQQILKHIPFVIPFKVRVQIFREWIKRDREVNGLDAGQWLRPVAHIEVQRGHVFEDAYDGLDKLGSGLKNRVAVTFKSLDGLVEAGIDGYAIYSGIVVSLPLNHGGVFKEFLSELLKEVFAHKRFNLFQTTQANLIYPQSNFGFDSMRLKYMEFFGRVIGKALYEGILIDAEFAGFFLSKWLNRQSYLDDLRTLDVDIYRNLISIKNRNVDVDDMGLDFTVTDEFVMTDPITREDKKITRTVELIKDGSKTAVTNENKIRYIYLMANYKLNARISAPCKAFFDGLNSLINTKWLRIFNQTELQILVGGASVPIDIQDLQNNINYNGDYHEHHQTIRFFWETVDEMSEEERRLLVKFVTSCERPPLLGFSELNPKFCIHPSGSKEERLRK
ncbi:hypothetical protein HK100_006715 [Physocladia obscura]|uniref:HECT-type E3 ubiquitin transferase n=1 Tax=Physocladia obscura TaxID=109957 RepID=A0AAD5SR33_9FUNG|nr:hypothetical protein HK100_006715 [Physocladia obscura]